MAFSHRPSTPLRRLALVGAAFVVSVLSCGREVGGPTAPGGGAALIPFDHVHLVLRHADGSVALDTVVTFPPGTDQITLTLTVPLAPGARRRDVQRCGNGEHGPDGGDAGVQGELHPRPERLRGLPRRRQGLGVSFVTNGYVAGTLNQLGRLLVGPSITLTVGGAISLGSGSVTTATGTIVRTSCTLLGGTIVGSGLVCP